MYGYVFLAAAILLEIFSTSMLKASAGFTRLIPSITFAVGMSASFYMLSLSLRTVPLSIAYAIWSGVGLVLTTLVSVFYWKEDFNLHIACGIALILVGVTLLNLKGPGH